MSHLLSASLDTWVRPQPTAAADDDDVGGAGGVAHIHAANEAMWAVWNDRSVTLDMFECMIVFELHMV